MVGRAISKPERNRRSNFSPWKKQVEKGSTTSSSWAWANRWPISQMSSARSESLMHPGALGIGARHITVSTSGLAPQIRQLAEEPLQVRLAISLHGATDEVRNQIMPVNRKYNLTTLLGACRLYGQPKKHDLFRIHPDRRRQRHRRTGASSSQDIARTHSRTKINLIPYNTVEGLNWSRPSRSRDRNSFFPSCAKQEWLQPCAAKKATTLMRPAVSCVCRRSANEPNIGLRMQ